MADSSSKNSSCDASSLKFVSNSLFNIPGFVMGFTKGISTDIDSIRSPTSTLDFGIFSIYNPFSLRCTRSSSYRRDKNQWDQCGLGLAIVNSLVDEAKDGHGGLDLPPQRKNIIFGPEVKGDLLEFSTKSNSLPKNYVISPLSRTRKSEMRAINSDDLCGSKRLTLGSQNLTSMVTSMPDSTMIPSSRIGNKKFCVKNNVLQSIRGPEDDCAMETPLNSVRMPIDSTPKYSSSLSAKDIELSEDYTCIISYGPNPRTTHIFCDCVLECRTNELSFFCNKDQPHSMSGSPDASKFSEGSTPLASGKVMSSCYSCNKKMEEGADIYLYSEKTFCSFDCRAEEIMAEEELDKTDIRFSESSSDLLCNEDLFPMGL